jgi:DNA repair protein RecO (recombination protein O)
VTASARGVVLRTIPLRESDLMVTLLTAEHGRISAVARGARKSQRRFAGALQLLVLGRFQLSRSRGELFTLEAADVEREWTTLASDVIAVAHASYVAEIAGAIVPPEQPEPEAL